MSDRANGYDYLAEVFAQGRIRSQVGATQVGEWASSLGSGAEVLDVACGVGEFDDEGDNHYYHARRSRTDVASPC
jgi:2-polyprenyl-3-methyl-5-hydroxy-6-metoxy-1,4-benzoquinol methylase